MWRSEEFGARHVVAATTGNSYYVPEPLAGALPETNRYERVLCTAITTKLAQGFN